MTFDPERKWMLFWLMSI
uniref:Uncharacterized protein n=1 Tax=Rhizophora mucronata TaxID=61149 RepID=A0A2P2NAU2_RHIMU